MKINQSIINQKHRGKKMNSHILKDQNKYQALPKDYNLVNKWELLCFLFPVCLENSILRCGTVHTVI